MTHGTQPNGLPTKALGFDTISTHCWSVTFDWPDPNDSTWSLEPPDGQVYVLTGVQIKYTSGMYFPMESSLLIQAIIHDGIPPIELTRYRGINDLLRRADREEYVPVQDPGGGPITKPYFSLKYDFSIPVILWSSAGPDANPPYFKMDPLGNPKFGKFITKIADDVPFKYHDGTQLEMAVARYFVTKYEDPDFEG